MLFIAERKPGILFRDLVQQFSPETKVVVKEKPDEDDTDFISYQKNGRSITVSTSDGFSVTTDTIERDKVIPLEDERIAFFKFLENYFDKHLDWGMLTGVKPVKFYNRIAKRGFDSREVLEERFRVKAEKVDLLERIESHQRPILDSHQKENHVSLYLGVPICPQRCLYCSFVSTVLDKKRLLLTDYLEGLYREIRRTGELLSSFDIKVDTLYIGGGTPSVLNALEADKLISTLRSSFDLNNLEEFTFEAGRPETTSDSLLKVLRSHDVSRICLNPQTFNDETLRAINRNHTAEDIRERYFKMREMGFENINMDLIAGLEGEREQDFFYSLERALELEPDNITVHDLSVKHGSKLNERDGHHIKEPFMGDFHREVENILGARAYFPYYMYRQKYTIGNGENVGYAKRGKVSLYNVLMMAEEQTIIGLGAGSTGKLYEREIDRFSPVFTVKDIRTYNMRADEIIEKKLNDYNKFFTARINGAIDENSI